MANKVITYKIKVVNESGDVVEKTANSMNDLNESVSQLENELKKAELGSDKFKQLQKDLKNSKGALEEAQNSTMSLGEKFSSIPGPIGQVSQGVKGLNTAFKALVANPIGAVITAIVLALTGLYKAFTSTKAGAEQVEQIMAGLSATLDVLRDRVLKAGGAIIKFFSGDFKGAANDAKAAVSGLGSEIVSEFQQAAKIKKELQSIEDSTRELNKERAKQNKLISEAKLKINDENLSIEERQKALEEVRKAEVSLAKQEEELARRRFEAIQAQNALSDSSKEALDEEAAAYTALQQAQQSSLNIQKELFDQEKALRDKAAADRKARNEEYKKNLEDVRNFENELRLSLIEDERTAALEKQKLDFQTRLTEIDALKTTETKKKELRAQLLMLSNKEIQDINTKFDEDEKKKQEEKDNKEKEDAAKALERERARIDAVIQLESMKEIQDLERLEEYLNKRMEIELANTELSDEEKNLIRAKYSKQLTDIKEKEGKKLVDIEKLKQQAEQESINLAIGAFDTLVELAGAETDLGKMLAVISTTISTYDAAQKAYASQMAIATPDAPIRAGIAAGIAVAQGLSRVNKIMNTSAEVPTANVQKKAYGGMIEGQGSAFMDNIPTMLSSGESVINARSTSMFRPLLSQINEMGGGARFTGGITSNGIDASQMEMLSSIRGSQEKPIKAYVVSSQMTNQAMLDRQQKSRSLI